MTLELLCDTLSKKIASEEFNCKEMIEVISYGLSAIITSTLNMGIALFIASLFGLADTLLKFMMIFIPIRIMHKGYHCKKFSSCLIMTNLSFFTCSLVIFNLRERVSPIIVFIILILINFRVSKEKNYKFIIFILIEYLFNLIMGLQLEMYFVVSLVLNIILIIGGKYYESKS
ncbi:accessory gene regulator B family protein [Thomasclavelia cocleata]|jgi:accessory gene regulator protein AgrB|uniref:accessory gene regulator B family protein n=2 Tax=Thomasclavelia cocleata TaxID=69824 RepID=UPI00241E132D|nr:accessory gene regulator B family protein [Thomasclavelia cocleata]MCI9630422.1 hypothetical protein [Thomasclavelia cocleata]